MEQPARMTPAKFGRLCWVTLGGWQDKLQGRSAPVLGRSRVQMPTMPGKCDRARPIGACCARGRAHSVVAHLTELAVTSMLLVAGRPCFGGGWYVGNGAAGEWIQFTNVWLSAGSYRFTANAGSPTAGASLPLEMDGSAAGPRVSVPNTGRGDSFGFVHLGSTNLAQGYHPLRVVFETSGVSLQPLLHLSASPKPNRSQFWNIYA